MLTLIICIAILILGSLRVISNTRKCRRKFIESLIAEGRFKDAAYYAKRWNI